MAEFDNFRKRTEKEKASMYQIGAREVIEKILPVVDNFERGLATVPQEDAANPYAEGMEKIYKQLMTVLDDLGVKAIEAVGQEFNPDFHNAVMHVEDEEAGENVIVEEFQKGYLYAEVRHGLQCSSIAYRFDSTRRSGSILPGVLPDYDRRMIRMLLFGGVSLW